MKKLVLVIFCIVCAFCEGRCQEYVQNTIQSSSLVESSLINVDDWFKVDSVFLYGGGKLLSLVTGDNKTDETTSPTGSLGLNFSSSRLSCNFFFSYNARQQVTMNSLSNFGNSLMNPDRSGQSFAFSMRGRLFTNFGFSSSFHAADQEWILSEGKQVDASPIVTKLGFYIRPFNFNAVENKVDFTLDFHFTNRVISGEFGKVNQTINNTLIKRRGYNGWDIQANVRLNAVKVYAQFSGNKVDGLDIPGFSGNQVLLGIDVTGELIKLK